MRVYDETVLQKLDSIEKKKSTRRNMVAFTEHINTQCSWLKYSRNVYFKLCFISK